jgi:peptidyl-prolyl cis-trans isomerase B (cyclophilin B)
MNFVFLIISLVLISGFVGSVFAQTTTVENEISQADIDRMKNKAVLITMNDGSFLIEFFPEDAPNTVKNFLELVESGYYDGIIFHRVIPGFMIQAGDPNTIDPDSDRETWGQGGPGYQIREEFNTLQHDRGIISMARSQHVDSAGSQFFIMHEDDNRLDGKYTVFGRLVMCDADDAYVHDIRTECSSFSTLDKIAYLQTDRWDRTLDAASARIIKAEVLDSYFAGEDTPDPERNISLIKKMKVEGGITERYINTLHNIEFDIPYRWAVVEGEGNYLNLTIEPTELEHNVQQMIDETGFTPKILIGSEQRNRSIENAGVSPAYFSLKGGDEPKVLSNYIIQNDEGRKAHIIISTQNIQTLPETTQFKIIQIHFSNSDTNYSIIHINLTEWFRYEINSFYTTVRYFEISIDGVTQPIDFGNHPVFQQLITDSREKPEPESLPPARIGGCLIATASYGSELAPQVQQLRELRDNTVLQTESGTVFMAGFNQFYYSFSPIIADYERENPAFKEAVKITLTPLLTSLTLLQYVDIDSEYEMLGYGISIILLNIGMYFVAPAVLITKIRSFYKLQ